jgi:hypothetical protein
MANNCYNYVCFDGSNESLRKLQDKFDKYDDVNYFTEFGDFVLDLSEIDNKAWLASVRLAEPYDYGTKWWDFEIHERDYFRDEDLIVSGDSAWAPPIKLIEEICKKYELTAEMEYEEGGMDFAGFVSIGHKGIVLHREMTAHEYYYESDVGNWMENLSYNYEGCEKEELEQIREEHKYASKGHLQELVDAINKINS